MWGKESSGGRAEVRFIGWVKKPGEDLAEVEILDEFREGLRGIDEFSHLIILYWFHLRDHEEERRTLLVFPRRHAVTVEKGVFACRSPSRPNPIGLCVVELIKIEGTTLTVRGLDAFGGSPIIDIKPYLPRADSFPDARVPEWTLRGPKT
ncbi:MAG: S-adenosyl-L-methionine-binding protein [Candidatus Bathyarchaeota archaeon B63]|nr:MAG: S-adenosyl-L-methionine-binding protein [Candidatus Bathyarchaeota archaeon B63]